MDPTRHNDAVHFPQISPKPSSSTQKRTGTSSDKKVSNIAFPRFARQENPNTQVQSRPPTESKNRPIKGILRIPTERFPIIEDDKGKNKETKVTIGSKKTKIIPQLYRNAKQEKFVKTISGFLGKTDFSHHEEDVIKPYSVLNKDIIDIIKTIEEENRNTISNMGILKFLPLLKDKLMENSTGTNREKDALETEINLCFSQQNVVQDAIQYLNSLKTQ